MIQNNYFIENFEQSPLIIQIVWTSIVIIIFLLFIIIIYLKYLRSILRKNDRLRSELEKKYETAVINYLYAGDERDEISDEQQSIIDELKSTISEPCKRDILISTLLKLSYEISGEMAESIHKLYIHTGLLDYSLAKLRNRKWNIIADGIREVTLFHVKEVQDQIKIHINHPKIQVRSAMQLYLVNLFHFEGLDFLNHITTPISEWDQIQLLEVLHLNNNQKVSDIKLWLNSPNESVVFFALKLAKIYNQYGAKNELIALLNHENIKIRIHAIHLLSYLNIIEAKITLKNNFEKLTLEEQIVFFEMLENLYEKTDKPFILEHILNTNFDIKFSALKILKNLNIDEFNSFKNLTLEPEFVRIVKYIESN
ncbi:TM2 domain-containing membrane protein YozV [Flavobacterium sp. CG_9.10]|uniref:hypothetical protein n=1 Tax=Flavobacterium sp. CG_9.10 TaxID=2787729 RepID=UPI0018CB25A1|nr:hypothetical protein [Flavobacterium sp. CG_9.10]MBG6109555.1 TM2 domain-containing membrane protein YozV [Flavobacterium sp. CG_9.10]